MAVAVVPLFWQLVVSLVVVPHSQLAWFGPLIVSRLVCHLSPSPVAVKWSLIVSSLQK